MPDEYNPPLDCTESTTEKKSEGHRTVGCTALGYSDVGCNVFMSNDHQYYCQLDQTLVTIDLTSVNVGKDYVMAIFDSLTPADATELQKY